MEPSQIIFGALLAALLIAVAIYYAWRQKAALATLRAATDLTLEDRLYLRRQISRRLWCSVLMLVFAGFLVGWFFISPKAPADDADLEAKREFAWLLAWYWGPAFLVLFGIIALAASDFLAIARFARRKQRQLEADRQAILQSHRSRTDRNGHQ